LPGLGSSVSIHMLLGRAWYEDAAGCPGTYDGRHGEGGPLSGGDRPRQRRERLNVSRM